MRRKIAAGNWKMNGTRASLEMLKEISAQMPETGVEVVICPPATLIDAGAAIAANTSITIGAQDCHPEKHGAHTGDISALMLVEAGAQSVILGHSERRQDHTESDALICAKALSAQAAGLQTIICVGEALAQRERGKTLDVIAAQLAGSVPDTARGDNLVIAYEPIWAIGTGQTASLEQIGEVHAFIRSRLSARFGAQRADAMPILYGGSVKPDNAKAIFSVAHVDGALVGGASLAAKDFVPIIQALAGQAQ